MPRVDVWDIPEDKPLEPIWIGYKRGLTDKYDFGRQLGEGGFGSVRVVVQKSNGAEFACKSICKRLDVPNLPPIKQQQHLENIKREVLILRKLRGTLNVVHLSAAYEDDSHVHIIMEYCRGGELFHKMGRRHYSEQTVASYMRAVLRTLAQCHAHRILHRDIKPGNFMLLTDAQDAPLKAIDFGLAVFFDPAQLPRTDLGLEGTPWYMAPEVLSSNVAPASDVWAAGVMAYQLLSGRFPFDDWAHPEAPALSLVWRSILSEAPSFRGSCWREVTQPAQDFCKTLLNKDPATRPTAREALAHPWLQKGSTRQRMQGAQLTQVVQRLQRHSQQNVFKKTVLDMMANELLARHMARTHNAEQQQQQQQGPKLSPPGQHHQQQQQQPAAVASPLPPARGGAAGGVRPLTGLLGGVGSSVTPQYAEGSLHRQQQLLRLIPPAQRTSSSLELSSPEVGPAAQHGTAHTHPEQQSGLHEAGPGVRPGVLRLEGTWHGPRAGVLHRQVLLPGVGWGAEPGVSCAGGGQPPGEGSTHMRGVGSCRGATSALEALRRARERAAAAAASAGGDVEGTWQGVHPAPAASNGPTAAGAAAAVGPDGVGAGVSSYKGPVKDCDTASLWDMQFMANRLAMEGSAHGNAYTQRLLKVASTHAGKTPAAAAMLQAAAAIAAQQQQSGTTPDQSNPTPAVPQQQAQQQTQQQAQQQTQQQTQPPSPQQWQGHVQLQAAAAAVAARAAAGRMEGTWHGPPRSTSISTAEAARHSHGAPEAPDLSRDLSWHGVTSHMRHLNEAEVASGSARALQRQEFLRFLEGARRQRLEQRKVARLVLEGSMHGGVQYFLPARGTSSVAVPAGAAAAPASGPGSLMECDDDEASEGDTQSEEGPPSEEEQQDTGALRGVSQPTGAGAQASPGSSGRGGSAAAAAGLPSGASPRPAQAATGLLGKLKRSFKQIITPNTAAAAGRGRGHGTPSACSSGSGSCSDLNTLARQSWRPDAAAGDQAAGVWNTPALASELTQQGLQGHAAAGSFVAAQGGTPKAAAAAAGLPAVGPAESSGGGRGGGGPQAQLAEHILELQSPGWQASLETRRRGQGAYAALMAATNLATELGAGQPHAPNPDSTAAAAAGGASLLVADTGDTAQQPAAAAAGAPGTGVPAAAAAWATGTAAAAAAGSSHPSLPPVPQPVAAKDIPSCSIGLTPLEQALQGAAQQPRQQQQQQGVKSTPLEQAAIDKQQQQQQQVLLPAAGQPEQLLPLPGGRPLWQQQRQQAQQGSMLPMPVSKQQQQQQQASVGHHLLPQPGSHRPAAAAAGPSSGLGLVQPGSTQPKAAAPHAASSLLPVPGGTRQHTGHTAAAAAAQPSSVPVPVGHAGFAPFWTFGAGGAVGADPSLLPKPGGGGASTPHARVGPAAAGTDGGSGIGSGTAAGGVAAAAVAAHLSAGGAVETAGLEAAAAPAAAPLVSQPPATSMQEAAGVPRPKPTNEAAAAAAAAAIAAVTSVGTDARASATTAATSDSAAAAAAPASGLVFASSGGVHLLPELAEVQQLLDLLAGSSSDLITVEQLQQGLVSLGYSLEPSEVLELAQNLGYGVAGTEGVALSQFAASQLDWENIQVNHRDEWLQCLRSTFDAMDVDKDGRLKPSEILEALRDKLPEAEVNAAIEDVLLEAAADEDEGLDFAAFKMLASIAGDAATALDQFDARLRTSYDAGGSVHSQTDTLQLLQPVSEAPGS